MMNLAQYNGPLIPSAPAQRQPHRPIFSPCVTPRAAMACAMAAPMTTLQNAFRRSDGCRMAFGLSESRSRAGWLHSRLGVPVQARESADPGATPRSSQLDGQVSRCLDALGI